MEFPPGKETMRSFPGMINYLNRYSALSAHFAAPLSALTHQAVDCKPGNVHFENFNRLKLEISNMKALPYFDVNAETTLQMDASKKGQMVLHWKVYLMHKMHNAHHMHQGHASQHMRTLGNQPSHLVIFICKDTIAPGLVVMNVEL